MSNKLIIIDHFLVGQKGHEEQYDYSIARQAIAQGIQTEVWCPVNSQAAGEPFLIYCLMVPFWRRGNRIAMMLAALSSIFEWRTLLTRKEMDKETIVLLETVKLPILFFMSLGLIGIKLRPRLAIVVRREFGSLIEKWLMLFLYKRKNVRFFPDSDLITEQLQAQGFAAAITLPFPHLPPRQPLINQTNKIIIGYFGEARYDKGFDLLPELIEKLFKLNKYISFIIQANVHRATSQMALADRALSELADKYPHNICILKGYLNDDEYLRSMRKCTVLLIPYRREYYGLGTSGLLAGAIVCGAWAVVPAGTWMSEQHKGYDQIISFNQANASELSAAVLECLEMGGKSDQSKLNQQIDEWYRFHSPQNYLNILLAAVKYGQ